LTNLLLSYETAAGLIFKNKSRRNSKASQILAEVRGEIKNIALKERT